MFNAEFATKSDAKAFRKALGAVKAFNYVKTMFYLRPLESIVFASVAHDYINHSTPAGTTVGRIIHMYQNKDELKRTMTKK